MHMFEGFVSHETVVDTFINLLGIQSFLSRRWSTGRLVVSSANTDTNKWLNSSELSIAGRPLSTDTIYLPRQRDLLLPESVSADDDLRLADRTRPSPEQVSAQKGREKMNAMWGSLFKLSEWSPPGPVLLVNLTGYVEDCGVSVSR